MNTPTPRTEAAWAKTFEDDENQCRAGNAASDMRCECATLERELAALTAERDQLRSAIAEMPTCRCDRSTEQQCELSAKVTALTAERDQLRARAEKAEAAETVALAKWNGALERALKAEAELATERARLRHVALDAAMKGGEK
jgi:hypothetical protein